MNGSAHTLTRLVLVLSSAALIGACAKTDDVAVSDTMAADTTAIPSIEAGSVDKEYTNAEMFGLLDLSSDGEIEVSRLASTKATNAEVKAYARKVVTEHTALNKEVASMASTMGVTPTVPENDEDIAENNTEKVKDLTEKAKGKEFDESYIEHAIKMHKTIIDEVKDALDNENQTPEVRAFLQRTLGALEGHLQAAEAIEKKFGV